MLYLCGVLELDLFSLTSIYFLNFQKAPHIWLFLTLRYVSVERVFHKFLQFKCKIEIKLTLCDKTGKNKLKSIGHMVARIILRNRIT